MNKATIQLAAAGRAYQAVAQSAAIAIQDATDYLRSVGLISSTGYGIGLAMVIAGDSNGSKVIDAATKIGKAGLTQFQSVTQAATHVAVEFPKSFG